MNGKKTTIKDPQTGKTKSFTYDHSYWSFDGGRNTKTGYIEPDPSHPNGKKYCDQKSIYNDLGKGIIKNAWAGYNATLFAYGQTGSGKSWSVIGYGTNKGLVPLVCEELFEGIRNNKEQKQFEVRFSMLEIYNEVVRDLLNPTQNKSGLKIREHSKKGFYAEGLRKLLVSSQTEIEDKMQEGTVNRTIRSTNMNATSSRAHTIVAITFIQKFKNERGQETAKTAVINLVDLAGSERVESTGATGERLKEGAAINLSLTALGNCINALVKQSQGESVRVPYRDSSLTKLLKNALGGNSKTVMIAAISPADINYDETVSTLNFADRAKQIKTKAHVNEDPTEKLIRELKEENERLKKSMASGKIDVDFIDEDGDGIDDRDAAKLRKKWEEEMRAQMHENDAELINMKKTLEEKLKNAKTDNADHSIRLNLEEAQSKPHIYNLNSDAQLTGKVIHILKPGDTTVGNRKGKGSDITMTGPSMHQNHAVFNVDKKGAVTIQAQDKDSKVLVNGSQIKTKTFLQHNDRLVFGSVQFWVFRNPQQKGIENEKYPEITYEFVQEEITAKCGFELNNVGCAGMELKIIQQELQELAPAVQEANSISEDLDRKAKFEIVLLSPQMMGKTSGKTEFHVKLKNLETGTEFVWPKTKFMDRLYKMREMYNNYEEEDEWDLPEERDPFQESTDTEVHIGTVQFIVQPIAYMVELKEQLEIMNIKAVEVGVMNIEVIPCQKNGKEYTEKDDVFVDNPETLIGKDLYFKLKILNCRGLPNRYSDIYCSYQFYLDKEEFKTKKISDTVNPNFNYEKKFSFKPVTKQFLDYLMTGSVTIKVLGKQKIRKSAIPLDSNLSTRELLKNDKTLFSKTSNLMNGFQMNGRVVDPQRQSIIVELLLMKKTQARLQQKVDNVQKLIKEAENSSQDRVSTATLRELLNLNNADQVDALIKRRLAEDSGGKFIVNGTAGGSTVCQII